MDGAAEQQQLLGQRRLAGVGMGDDRERAPQAGRMAGQAGVEIGDDGGIGHFFGPSGVRGGSGPALRRQPGTRLPDRIDVTTTPISRVLAVLSGEQWDGVYGNSLGGIGLRIGRERPTPARRVRATGPIAGAAAAGAERTARAGGGVGRAVAAGDAVQGDDAGPAVQPVGRLARLFGACRACRLPRRLGPAELPADGARLPSARARCPSPSWSTWRSWAPSCSRRPSWPRCGACLCCRPSSSWCSRPCSP